MDWVLNPAGEPYDRIEVTGISARGHHGVLAAERAQGQTFTVDVCLHLDTTRAAQTDQLADTVSYAEVAALVADVIGGEPVFLLETLAQRIADQVLALGRVVCADVQIHKPEAPMPVPVTDVAVRIRRFNLQAGAVGFPLTQATLAGITGGPASPVSDAAAPGSASEIPASTGAIIQALRDAGQAVTRRAIAEVKAQAEAEAQLPDERLVFEDQAAPATLDEMADPALSPAVDLDTPPRWPADAILGLGANLGDALGTLRDAVTDLSSVPGIEVIGVSPLARTKPVGNTDQPDFFNAVVAIRTTLSPRSLLDTVAGIEEQHGRTRTEHWGPRTLDIDIVAYDTLLAGDDELEIPHPRAHERAFVLLPWATLSPDAFLPGLDGGSVQALAERAPDRDGVRWLALDWMTLPVAISGALPKPPTPDELPWRDRA
ncbi:MAG: 2-amino-4-hydroxy-6-hydroxymethyldihydropteridine diphosphokinase [Bifidobacteriaceae bacterium]|jgi:dihydroneopterin aldolase/2-amino-4-hydroxy-6-hydroxymethyldihydropteridine diphosphokinase|nr:2-amino-4-hydroxy-6-hydroxymethyldihydropteridine diphosphokinase [Bifidobacteriaceae bacterium]